MLGLKHSATAISEGLAVRQALEPLIAAEAASNRGSRTSATCGRSSGARRTVDDPAGYLRANWVCTGGSAQSAPTSSRGHSTRASSASPSTRSTEVEGRGVFDGAGNLEVHREYVDAIASGDPKLAAAAALRHNAAASYPQMS